MYLQVVHYYDQKAQRRLLLQYMHQSRKEGLKPCKGGACKNKKGQKDLPFHP